MKNEEKIILVGGGTGGHAAPVLAVYRKLKEKNKNLDITVVGVGSSEEKFFLENLENYFIIKSGKLRRHFTLKNIFELFNLICGFFQAIKLIYKQKPKIIFSKGGYVSLPIVYAAKLLKIPYFFHESDIEMGKTNRYLAKSAEKIFVTYPLENYKGVEKEKMVFSGPVLREGFDKNADSSRKIFGFNNNKPVILLTGGSQGSLHLSKNFLGAVKKILKDFNIIHQAGKHSIKIVKDFFDDLDVSEKKDYYVAEFLKYENGNDMMLSAIDSSDLVISRAGSTIVELAIKNKPMILVPWKHSAQNHQEKNAQFFESKNCAVIIRDDELNSDIILSMIKNLFADNGKKISEISDNVGKLFPKNGTEKIVEEILKKLEQK